MDGLNFERLSSGENIEKQRRQTMASFLEKARQEINDYIARSKSESPELVEEFKSKEDSDQAVKWLEEQGMINKDFFNLLINNFSDEETQLKALANMYRVDLSPTSSGTTEYPFSYEDEDDEDSGLYEHVGDDDTEEGHW